MSSSCEPNVAALDRAARLRAASIQQRLVGSLSSDLRNRNLQVLAYLAGKKLEDLAVAGNGGGLARAAIDKHGVIPTFSEELAPVAFKRGEPDRVVSSSGNQ